MFMLAVLSLARSIFLPLLRALALSLFLCWSYFWGAKCSAKIQTIFKAIDRPQQIFHTFHYFNSGNMTHVSMDSTYTMCAYWIQVYTIHHTPHTASRQPHIL